MTPSAYHAGETGSEIRFSVGQSSLGSVLVAQSATGICAILLGDDPEGLTRELRGLFPDAVILCGDSGCERITARVIEFVETPTLRLDMPLDIRGTVFQRRVWQALREIAVGATASYTAIAAKLGLPNSARAVAQACAANLLAVVIPCHRVVRSDGHLSGYRWGIGRKRALLDREARGAGATGVSGAGSG